MLKKSAIVDASITDSPHRPWVKKEYEAVEDRKESGRSGEEQTAAPAKQVLAVKPQKHVDTEAA